MNLRKDHCRYLQSQNDPRTCFKTAGRRPSGRRPEGRGNERTRGRQPNPGANRVKEHDKTEGARRPARLRLRRRTGGRRPPLKKKHKRLSATDISALASMKNVAKCDTWCELQNPVNHRVFERKLRPKPSGRGHACLGVTHRVAPPPRLGERGADDGLPLPSPDAAGPKHGPPAADVTASGGRISPLFAPWPSPSSGRQNDPTALGPSKRRSAPTATPGQAGLPAEFKHINKRRKRNLQGFP